MDYKQLVQQIKDAKSDTEIENILKVMNHKLFKPIVEMREALKNDVLPNDEVIDPYDIDLSYNGISIYKSWYDYDAKEVDEEKIYHIGYEEFLRMMFDIPVKKT